MFVSTCMSGKSPDANFAKPSVPGALAPNPNPPPPHIHVLILLIVDQAGGPSGPPGPDRLSARSYRGLPGCEETNLGSILSRKMLDLCVPSKMHKNGVAVRLGRLLTGS